MTIYTIGIDFKKKNKAKKLKLHAYDISLSLKLKAKYWTYFLTSDFDATIWNFATSNNLILEWFKATFAANGKRQTPDSN